MKKYIIPSIVVVALLVFYGSIYGPRNASAITNPSPTAADFSGWAWSSNTGWVSVNGSDAGTGTNGSGSSPYPYKVTADLGTGQLSGYAWSQYLGWISFNSSDVSSCGSAPTILSNGQVTGWAKVLSLASGDGCIELSGSNHAAPNFSGYQGTSTQGLTLSSTTDAISGFAWEPTDAGWMQFNIKCPGCSSLFPPTDYAINATCSQKITTDPTTGYVTASFSSTASSNAPTPTYTYIWNPGTGGTVTHGPTSLSTDTYGITYTPGTYPVTYSPSVTVKDNQGDTAYASCGSVTVSPVNTNGTSNAISLGIGSTVSQATQNEQTPNSTITIRQQRPFALAWTNTLDNTKYSCTATMTADGNNWSNYWNNGALTDSNGNFTSSNTGQYMSSGLAPYGTYTFTMTCSPNNTGTTQTATANLKIISASEGEK
ncbi:hypothetical protein KGP36_00400 [Patescibacteria group bacterium]|nr:hypothetical protein [Patescibacteria group bacterium]MDE1940787.1 hypothetical protein [Patescibacteria group bacterium]